MSRLYFSADAHWGHNNILKYCGRPFQDARHMWDIMSRSWNEMIKPDDTVYHIGDWCCYGKERGVEGSRNKADWYERGLNGKIIHIEGNHDGNNGVKFGLRSAVIRFGGMKLFLRHRPLVANDTDEYGEVICDLFGAVGFDAMLCGHVHNKWKFKWFQHEEGEILCVNVGVDVWNYRPVEGSDLVGEINREKRRHTVSD